jgi:alginate O-acetyltransferase complex protein AlgI
LAFFKYYNFFIDNINHLSDTVPLLKTRLSHLSIMLPIGLSFHTFQAMSYTIEVYRGNQKAERHFGIYALYVMFYPQLVAGPIERPQNILPQLHEKKYFQYENLFSGFRLILWGLFKKCVIADRLAIAVDSVYDSPSGNGGFSVIMATIFFAIQIYCDFSGYSDIALGTARIMGFRLMQNFKQPYFSKNVSEFWARWHISLSSWFRDYLYIPLGGNRVKIYRIYFNLMFVFIISGFWHGANWTFIVWGTIHGILLILNLIIKKKMQYFKIPGVLSIGFTFIVVCIAWIFFRANSINDAQNLLGSIFKPSVHYFSMGKIDLLGKPSTYLGLPLWNFLTTICLVPLLFFLDYLVYTKKYRQIYLLPSFARWSVYYILIFSIIVFGVFNSKQFIYFQF